MFAAAVRTGIILRGVPPIPQRAWASVWGAGGTAIRRRAQRAWASVWAAGGTAVHIAFIFVAMLREIAVPRPCAKRPGGQFRDLPGSKVVSRLRYGRSTLYVVLRNALGTSSSTMALEFSPLMLRTAFLSTSCGAMARVRAFFIAMLRVIAFIAMLWEMCPCVSKSSSASARWRARQEVSSGDVHGGLERGGGETSDPLLRHSRVVDVSYTGAHAHCEYGPRHHADGGST